MPARSALSLIAATPRPEGTIASCVPELVAVVVIVVQLCLVLSNNDNTDLACGDALLTPHHLIPIM
jgi:hypothetical protein